jgi:putative transposase
LCDANKMIVLSHKIRINPTVKQDKYFRQASGISRFAYNWGLAEWKRQYKAGLKPTALAVKKAFNAIKPIEFPWVFDVTKCAPEQAFADLGTAFKRFFKHQGKYPKFKKKGIHDSFYLANDQFKIDGFKIRIPKLGWVRLSENLRLSGKILSATISRTADHWFVSISVQLKSIQTITKNQGDACGVDLGIKNLATLSNGEMIAGPKPLKICKLAKMQRHLAKCTKGSKRYYKYRMKLARLHYRIQCIRQDSLHKLTNKLCRSYKIICLENLNVKGMMKNHKLAKAISDIGFHEFKRQIEYKSKLFDNWISIVDRWFPSSKTCSNCGSVKTELQLSQRTYSCDNCGIKLDRDINAALNIKAEGIRLLA